MKASTAAGPTQEWLFAWTKDLKWQELLCARDYEFGREVPLLKQEVLKWRKEAQSSSFDDLLSHSWQIGPLGFIRSFFSSPEWPASPIETIGKKELSRRVGQLGIQPRISEWNLNKNTEALAAIIDPELVYCETLRETVVLSLPRDLTHEELRKCFAAYLKVRFPFSDPNRDAPKRPLAKWKADLKSLGAYRLLKQMTAVEAMSYESTLLYTTEADWSEAKTRARKVIKEYERATTELIKRRKRLGKLASQTGGDGGPYRFH